MTVENHKLKIPHLQCVKGLHHGKLVPLSDPVQCLIGRTLSCHVVLESDDVRDVHARVYSKKGEWFAAAVHKDDKIIINHDNTKSGTITHGDTITIGRNSFVFLEADKEPPFGHTLTFRYIEETFVPVLVREDATETRRYELGEQTTTIGSEKYNDIVISDPGVSSNHGKIKSDEGCHSFVDLKSTNGSKINDAAVESETIITAGDEIRVGTVLLTFGFIRKDKVVKKEGGLEFTPLTVLLLIIASLIILCGAGLLILVLMTLYSDIPPFGPIKKTTITKLWISEESSKRPFTIGHFTSTDHPDLIIAPSDGRITCLSGTDGFPAWSHSLPDRITSFAGMIDSSQKKEETLVISSQTRVFALNKDGRRLWETPFGDTYNHLLYLCLDRTSKDRLYVVDERGSIFSVEQTDQWALSRTAVSFNPRITPAIKLSLNGTPVIHGLSQEGRLSTIRTDGTPVWECEKESFASPQKLVVGDIERDGIYELFLVSRDRKSIKVIESTKGAAIYSFSTPAPIKAPPALGNGPKIQNPLLIAYLENNEAIIFDCNSGKEIKRLDLTPFGGAGKASPCIQDINRDNALDLILATPEGNLVIISGKDFSTIAMEKLKNPSTGLISLADINGDMRMEIVVQLTDGRLEAFSLNCPVETGKIVFKRTFCFDEYLCSSDKHSERK